MLGRLDAAPAYAAPYSSKAPIIQHKNIDIFDNDQLLRPEINLKLLIRYKILWHCISDILHISLLVLQINSFSSQTFDCLLWDIGTTIDISSLYKMSLIEICIFPNLNHIQTQVAYHFSHIWLTDLFWVLKALFHLLNCTRCHYIKEKTTKHLIFLLLNCDFCRSSHFCFKNHKCNLNKKTTTFYCVYIWVCTQTLNNDDKVFNAI